MTGDPYRPEAAAAARRVKGYESERPFLCLVLDVAGARALAAGWPDAAERLAAAFWPGPLTLIVRAAEGAPEAVAAEGTIAVRPAADPVSRSLLAAWGGPLFSTSANRRGEPPTAVVEEAAAAVAAAPGSEAIALGVFAEGPVPAAGRPSSIVDVTAVPRLVRPGAITARRLRGVVPDLVEAS